MKGLKRVRKPVPTTQHSMLKTTTDLRQSVSKSVTRTLVPKRITQHGVALPVVQAVEDNAEVVDVELDSSVDLADFSENLN